MTRTMVYLPDKVHKGLKHLAIERHTSMAKLIQEAVEVLYQEDLEDLSVGRERIGEYAARPDQGIDYSSYREKRLRR